MKVVHSPIYLKHLVRIALPLATLPQNLPSHHCRGKHRVGFLLRARTSQCTPTASLRPRGRRFGLLGTDSVSGGGCDGDAWVLVAVLVYYYNLSELGRGSLAWLKTGAFSPHMPRQFICRGAAVLQLARLIGLKINGKRD